MVHSSTFRTSHQHRHNIHQAKKLRQYLAGGGLLAAYGQSFGAQLERLAAAYSGTTPCRKCHGRRGTTEDGDQGGTGWIPRDPLQYRKRRVEHRRLWRRRGVKVPAAHLMPTAILSPDELVACPRCGGRGWISRRTHGDVDARPCAGAHSQGVGHMLDDTRLHLLGSVGRWLALVAATDWKGSQALVAYFGPDGGNVRACWHLTTPGLTLLRQKAPNEEAQQCFDRLVQEQQWCQDWRRTALMQNAESDASRLLDRGCRAWNLVVPSEDAEAETTMWRRATLCVSG